VTVDIVARIEAASTSTWSAEQVASFGGWTVSATSGFTRRINSATTIGSADVSAATGSEIETWLGERGVPMTIRVTPLVDAETAEGARRNWDLVDVDPTPVMTKRVRPRSGATHVELVNPSEDDFVGDVFALNGRDPIFAPQWRGIVGRLRDSAVGLWIPGIAVGLATISDGVCCVYSLAVHPERRRSGVATDVMAAAEGWAAGSSADLLALQVMGTNTGALALYRHLGYRASYEYTYLERPS
jgi:N-acetylglutamate synthase